MKLQPRAVTQSRRRLEPEGLATPTKANRMRRMIRMNLPLGCLHLANPGASAFLIVKFC